MHRFVLAAFVSLAAACGGPAAEGPAAASATPAPAAAAPEAAAPAGDPCPPGTWQQGQENGGTCLQPAVLGEAPVKACGAQLEQKGWQPDAVAASAIGQRLGQTVYCWRAPAP